MRKLSPLLDDAFHHFEAIVAAKNAPRKDLLNKLKLKVAECYQRYSHDLKELSALKPAVFEDVQKAALRHCYVVSTEPLEHLKSTIEGHLRLTDPAAAAMCQYCGLVHAPSSFDHYLPKETFAEYSTHSQNLVPSCERCNTLKGTLWLRPDNSRKIVSFYFDTLPNTRFLFAAITMIPRPEAEFRLSANAVDFDGVESVIRSHYKELDLLIRYKKAAPAEFSERERELADEVKAAGTAAAAAMLRKKANQVAMANSPNYWKVALLHAMAESDEFLTWCGR